MFRYFIFLSVIFLLVMPRADLAADPLSGKGNLSIELVNVPIVDALNMIAEQNDLNLVVSGNITGEITLHLDEVDLATALDAILAAMGFVYTINGEVIVIKSSDLESPSELVSHTIRLKYVNPYVAVRVLEPRLTAKGKAIVLAPLTNENKNNAAFSPNRITITDRTGSIDQLLDLIAQIDKADRMVSIEVKIIETKVDNSSKLGFQWPQSFGAAVTGANAGTTGATLRTSTIKDQNSAVRDNNNGTWTYGKLTINEAQVVLDALMRDGNSKLLSDPRITTAENYEAIISTQTVIPIQTINRFSEGAVIQDIVTYQDEEVGISVRVTPRINEDGRITLDVNPIIEDIIGYTGPPDNQKPITSSRSIKTRVTVNDGETLALGGLLKEDELITKQRVPILGYIPLLGNLLFTHTTVEKSTTDLTILITPHILPGP